MNLLLLEPEEVDEEGRTRISGRRAEHIIELLGKQVGDTVRAGIIGGNLGQARIDAIEDRSIRLTCECNDPPPSKRPIDLVLALPRPPVFRRVLQHATSMGVSCIYLMQTNRVEKSYWSSPALEPFAIDEQLRLGLEQAVDTQRPEVMVRRKFRPFVEDELSLRADQVLVAHPKASRDCPVDVLSRTTIVVGPEGGFVPFEIELFESIGASLVTLGPRVLRVETAVVAVLGRLGA
jgi:RsmE family RNA methyltransferase